MSKPISNLRLEEEVETDTIPYFLATLSLTLALATMTLYPATLAMISSLIYLPENVYLSWINKDLITAAWDILFYGSDAALFILIPYAYFYQEAYGFVSSRGLSGRLTETTLVVALFSALLVGALALLRHLLSPFVDPTHEFSLYMFSYATLVAAGSITILLSVPSGFVNLMSWCVSLMAPQALRRRQRSRLEALMIQQSMAQSNLQATSQHLVRAQSGPSITARTLAEKDVTVAQAVLDDLNKKVLAVRSDLQGMHPLVRNGSALLGLALTVSIPAAIFARVTLKLIHSHVWVGFLNMMPADLFDESRWEEFLISDALDWDPLEAGLDIVLSSYTLAAALIGLYSLPVFRSALPVRGNTSVRIVLLNVALWLLIGSALPISVTMMGLTNFDLMRLYKASHLLNQAPMLRDVYTFSFLVTSTLSWISFIRNSSLSASVAATLAPLRAHLAYLVRQLRPTDPTHPQVRGLRHGLPQLPPTPIASPLSTPLVSPVATPLVSPSHSPGAQPTTPISRKLALELDLEDVSLANPPPSYSFKLPDEEEVEVWDIH